MAAVRATRMLPDVFYDHAFHWRRSVRKSVSNCEGACEEARRVERRREKYAAFRFVSFILLCTHIAFLIIDF